MTDIDKAGPARPNLFAAKMVLHAPGFEAWPRHMQLEYMALAAERGKTLLDLHYATGLPERTLRNIRSLGCQPYALAECREAVSTEDAPQKPHQHQRASHVVRHAR